MGKSVIDWIALVLVIIGAIDLGLMGVGVGNVLDMIFGSVAWLIAVVYILIGLAGLYMIYYAVKM